MHLAFATCRLNVRWPHCPTNNNVKQHSAAGEDIQGMGLVAWSCGSKADHLSHVWSYTSTKSVNKRKNRGTHSDT